MSCLYKYAVEEVTNVVALYNYALEKATNIVARGRKRIVVRLERD